MNSAGAARCPKLAALTTPGNGAFVCGTVSGLDEDGETLTFVLARTWLSEDQLRDEQRFAVVGQELGTRLGDNVPCRQRGGWTDRCSATDPGAVQPARDGRVRHGYPYRSAPQARSHAVRPLPQERIASLRLARSCSFRSNADTRLQRDRAGTLIIPIPGAIARAMKRCPRCGPRPNGRAQQCPCPPGPGAGYELIEGHRCASTAGFVEPFNFAAVGARQPTSRARVLEVRIQSPPAVSLRTIGS